MMNGLRRRAMLGKAEKLDPYTWPAVIASVNKGTYATDYNVGDLIPLDLGSEGLIQMQIVAFNADVLANGTGYAAISFVGKELLATSQKYHSASDANTRIWENTSLRAYLKNTIKPLIPADVRSRIVEVTKYSRTANASKTVVNNVASTEDVWIPSAWEVGGSDCESTGVRYNAVFKNNNARIKKKAGTVTRWWLRSYMSGNANIRFVDDTGRFSYVTPNGVYGIALGFCIS